MELDYLSKNETQALLNTIFDPRDKAIITLFLTTGLFIQEAIGLTIADIDFEHKRLKVCSGKRPREIPLNDQAYEVLAIWSKHRIQTPVPNFFITTKGSPQKLSPNSIDKLIRKYAAQAGLKGNVNSKVLRTTFAVNLFSEDIPINQAVEILGITDPESIKRYLNAAKTKDPQLHLHDSDLHHTDTRSLKQKVISRLFPIKPEVSKPETKLNTQISPNADELILGRDPELAQIMASLNKKQSVVIIGGQGLGKSYLLKAISQKIKNGEGRMKNEGKNFPPASILHSPSSNLTTAKPQTVRLVFIDKPAPIKLMLSKIAQALELELPARPNAEILLERIITYAQSQAQNPIILIIDNLDKLHKTDLDVLLKLLESCTLLMAIEEKTPRLKPLWGKIKEVTLEPLSEEACRDLIKYLTQNLSISDYQMLETRLLNLANGSPGALVDMTKQLSYKPVVNRNVVRDLSYESTTCYRDWTAAVFVLWGVIVSFRFIALGTHSFEGYILAGLGTSILLVARFFLFRMR